MDIKLKIKAVSASKAEVVSGDRITEQKEDNGILEKLCINKNGTTYLPHVAILIIENNNIKN